MIKLPEDLVTDWIAEAKEKGGTLLSSFLVWVTEKSSTVWEKLKGKDF